MTSSQAHPANTLKNATKKPAGLLIRAVQSGDIDALTVLTNLPGYRAGTLRRPYQNSELTKRWLESQGPNGLNIVAVLEGNIIGVAGFKCFPGRRSHAAELGMGVHDDHQKRGVGTALLKEVIDAADNWFGVRRLELTVYTDNEQAIHLYKKFGFETEGTLRAYAFRAGCYANALYMARLRS
ncbi:GNAT family N-acetyltransferase [Beijerinckia indica]|uniref:GCN5-related N-acetyltransferase n=1 Tax=Beijerinckia indica subsp. indica (strain ATCC 9039 / DSM 1715 / NCIMB 8712) TaxID=395963 RepID=B2IHT3_BEII9|nr:GNAT family N-acetyltransferase [Beijerinckia indica]ACB95976.1 GCN5-related N-acetyltransferase [Beijerinckia indica subsp. indica ATCC 9039]